MENKINSMIEISINNSWKNKPAKVNLNNGYTAFINQNGKQINFAEGWRNITCTFAEAFLLVADAGYPIAPALFDDKQNKADNNFKSSSLILVDFDNGTTIAEATNHMMYKKYGSGYYTTPSNTKALPKFRLVFRLEQPIVKGSDMKLLYRYFLSQFNFADVSCKDACRYFNGSTNATEIEIRENYLPVGFVEEALKTQRQDELQSNDVQLEAFKREHTTYSGISEEKKAKIFELLCSKAVEKPSYNGWLGLCWSLKTCGFSIEEVMQISQARYNDIGHIRELWKSYKEGNVGAVINLCKREHGADCFNDIPTTHKKVPSKIAEAEFQPMKDVLLKVVNIDTTEDAPVILEVVKEYIEQDLSCISGYDQFNHGLFNNDDLEAVYLKSIVKYFKLRADKLEVFIDNIRESDYKNLIFKKLPDDYLISKSAFLYMVANFRDTKGVSLSLNGWNKLINQGG